MKSAIAFVCGVLVGGLLAALLLRPPPPPRGESRDDRWRERAETAEHELAEARGRIDALAGQLQDLAGRFESLTARFEALSAAPTPPAGTP